MPSWNDLLNEMQAQPDDGARAQWLNARLGAALNDIAGLRDGRNVLFYGSAFLQKPQLPGTISGIANEDINALMSVLYGMEWGKGLTLVLHTPGGATNAAESIVAYLRSKFPDDLEVIVPTFAMSAGTMISLAADRIWMGRQSQLGPIDPQLFTQNRQASAMAIVEQFEEARDDILANRDLAHVWAPLLQSQGPSLLKEAQNALAYSERMVAEWLERWMLSGSTDPSPREHAQRVAHYFNNATQHKSHGRRIDRDEARGQGLEIVDLEESQDLQEAVLTAYHLFTIMVEHGPAAKVLLTSHGRAFVKNHLLPR